MSKITIAEQIEKVINGLCEKEKAKKKRLKAIQDELKKYHKSLEPMRKEHSDQPRSRPRRKKPDEQGKARQSNVRIVEIIFHTICRIPVQNAS